MQIAALVDEGQAVTTVRARLTSFGAASVVRRAAPDNAGITLRRIAAVLRVTPTKHGRSAAAPREQIRCEDYFWRSTAANLIPACPTRCRALAPASLRYASGNVIGASSPGTSAAVMISGQE
jgi:hypothetical protein